VADTQAAQRPTQTAAGEALRLEKVNAGYGETVVLENIELQIMQGEALSIIGRNGVGKSTLLATVMGHTSLHSGRILLGSEDITRLSIHKRSRAGVGYVPQEREIFPSLTVMENLQIAARPGRWSIESVFELFPNIAGRASNMGNQLSGGEQQMLAIARALVGNPSVLLMDEPTEGLAPVIVDSLVAAMQKLRGDPTLAVILVEQHAEIALEFSPRTVVMRRGRIVYDGDSATLAADHAQLESLIGVASAADERRR
jgi:branched-chain amino acid transport system ATP-binding protein